MASFFFVLCQPGMESWVKRSVIQQDPNARFAFSRPGFITFKREVPEQLDASRPAPSPFAKVWGESLGRLPEEDWITASITAYEALSMTPDVVHVVAREGSVRAANEESASPDIPAASWVAGESLASRLRERAPGWRINEPARAGEVVFDLIEVDPGVVWVGWHRQSSGRGETPASRPLTSHRPDDAPSRVWSKVEEALWWSKLALSPGDLVLDIGCAPGGGSFNLLERGARVLGVDPAKMADVVLDHPNFQHLARAFEFAPLSPQDMEEVKWLFFDVNLSPLLTLKHLERLGQRLPNLRGALITLKMNKLELLDRLPWMLARIEGMRLKIVDSTQLYHNRQEICVYAVRI